MGAFMMGGFVTGGFVTGGFAATGFNPTGLAAAASGLAVASGLVGSLVATWREFMETPDCIFDASRNSAEIPPVRLVCALLLLLAGSAVAASRQQRGQPRRAPIRRSYRA
jgi:hypothetical protein